MRKKYVSVESARYKKISVRLVSRDSVVVKRAGQGRIVGLLDSVINGLKGAPDQVALELTGEPRSTYMTLRRHLVKQGYNLAYNSDKNIIWVWRGL